MNIFQIHRAIKNREVYRTRVDAHEPGGMKLQVVVDDGPYAGSILCSCECECDAKLICNIWNHTALMARITPKPQEAK